MNKTIRILLSLPKTVILNFKVLPFSQAVKLPLFVSYDTDLSIKGRIEIAPDAKVRTAMVRFGFLCALACDTNSRTRLHVQKGGVLRFMGDAHLGHGTRMIVREGAEMVLGDNFAVSSNSTIQCYDKVVFGSDVQFAWECLVMDSDTHNILDEDGKEVELKESLEDADVSFRKLLEGGGSYQDREREKLGNYGFSVALEENADGELEEVDDEEPTDEDLQEAFDEEAADYFASDDEN